MVPLAAAFLVSSLYLLACGVYLNLLVVAARWYRPRPVQGRPATRFVLFIPAHNESSTIRQTVEHLRGLDYPARLLRIIVIADNCTDETAQLAQAAGIAVWERSDPEHWGKGAALRWAMDRLSGQVDAVAVLDADSVASPRWLTRADAYLGAGADAVQAFYGIANAEASWRARLLSVALLLFHHIRPAGREVLGWSAGLKGNGMVFSRRLLARLPWSAYSVTEDLEYASQLAAAGVRVAYDGGSTVLGLAGLGRGARSQRLRWEGGRFGVLRRWTLPLLRRVLTAHSLIALDAAMELLVLPLGLLLLLAFVLVLATAGAAIAGLTSPLWLAGALVGLLLLATHVLGGLWAGHAPARSYATLALAVPYLAWKMLVYAWLAAGVQRNRWIRTDRMRD